MRIKEILTELKTYSKDSDYEDKHFILTNDGGVIFFDQGDTVDDLDLPEKYQTDDIEDLMGFENPADLSDGSTKYLTGMIKNNVMMVDSFSETAIDSTLNTNIKKMVKQYGFDGYEVTSTLFTYDFEHEINDFVEAEQLLKSNLSNTMMYHGTNTANLNKILKVGLKPVDFTNFKKINHQDKVFFTSKKSYAMYHAYSSAQKSKSFPIILELKVPDPSKIVLDYDVAVSIYGVNHPITQKLGYDRIHQDTKSHYSYEIEYEDIDIPKLLADKGSLNSKIGIFGYVGRVPVSHIKSVYVDMEAYIQVTEFDMDLDEVFDPNNMTAIAPKDFYKKYEEVYQELYPDDEEDEDY